MFDLAIFYRMAGGFVGLGSTTLTRVRWAFIIAVYMTFVSIVHHEAPLAWLIIFLGTFAAGYVGRLIPHSMFQNTASIGNSIGMSLVTVIRLGLILLPYLEICSVFHSARLLSLTCAIGAGIGYYIGNKYLNGKDCGVYYRASHEKWRISSYGITTLSQTPPAHTECLNQCAVGGTEWGELITGFSYQAFYMLLLVLQ